MHRRQVLQSLGGFMTATALGPVARRPGLTQDGPERATEITGRLARYMVAARDRTLPPEVVRAAKHRVLDTLGAIVSGARLKPGVMAISYVQALGGMAEASVPTTRIKTSAVNAALAAGMFAHADETDDFEPVTKAHPGCVAVPAAMAVAERENRSGE